MAFAHFCAETLLGEVQGEAFSRRRGGRVVVGFSISFTLQGLTWACFPGILQRIFFGGLSLGSASSSKYTQKDFQALGRL